jgi:hypothetical protein
MIGAKVLDHPLYGHFVCMTCRNNHRANDLEKLDLKILAAEDPDSMTDHQVKRHRMFQERAIHNAQREATRRQGEIERDGLLKFREKINVNNRAYNSRRVAKGAVPRKRKKEGTKASSVKRAIMTKGAKYPPFFVNMMKDALKTWIDECGDTHIFKDFTFRIFDILLDRMDHTELPRGVDGGEYLNPVPREPGGQVKFFQEEYYRVMYHFCDVHHDAPLRGDTKCFNLKQEFLQEGEAGEAARFIKRQNRARIDTEWEVLKRPTHVGHWYREIKMVRLPESRNANRGRSMDERQHEWFRFLRNLSL